jgi:EAL domain-containing protein (putative c-di-GMP-specific phosphodiesterase class I)
LALSLIRRGEQKGRNLGKELPWLLGGVLFAGVAFCVAGYGLGAGITSVNLIAVSLAALAAGQVLQLVRAHFQDAKIDSVSEQQADITAATYKMVSDQQRANAEAMHFTQSFEQFREETAELNQTMSEGMALLRQGHEVVAENVKSLLETQREVQGALSRVPLTRQSASVLNDQISREQNWVSQVNDYHAHEYHAPESYEPFKAAAPPSPPQSAPPPPQQQQSMSEQTFEHSELGEVLNVSLEPIVDLYTSNTAHYRMVLGMTNPRGQDVPHDMFVHYADTLGLRMQLDHHVVEQALALLGQLRQRDASLCIFVPIGAVTLANTDSVADIIASIRKYPSVSQGLVFDIPHAVLASLSDASLEGLAVLARAGITLSLSQASISGLDLSSLNRLNVRFVGLAAASVGLGYNLSKGLPGFVQSARALRIQTIISNVGDPRHVQGLSKVSRFACGPAFAVPRKLKRADMAQQANSYAA